MNLRRRGGQLSPDYPNVDSFLNFNKFEVLKGKGKISKKEADEKALKEYSEYNKIQPIESDFDKIVKKLEKE